VTDRHANFEKLPLLKDEEMGDIRDIVIQLTRRPNQPGGTEVMEMDHDDLRHAVAYVGDVIPRRFHDPNNLNRVGNLLDVLGKVNEPINNGRRRFRIEHNGSAFRAQVGVRPDGGLDVTLRALPKETPHLRELRMPDAWRTFLLSKEHLNGGLLLVSGLNGNGKTTTIAATVISRLQRFGGHANVVEDPSELPLDGPWVGPDGKGGYCAQRPADLLDEPGQPGTGYKRALYEAARQFPSFTGGGTILVVGEIRDEETAIEAVNGAVAGHFVLASVHSPSAVAAIDRVVGLASRKAGVDPAAFRGQLSQHLIGVLHQRLAYHGQPGERHGSWWDRAEVRGEVLLRDESGVGASKVASAIAKGPSDQAHLAEYSRLQTEALSALKGEVTMQQVRSAINANTKHS